MALPLMIDVDFEELPLVHELGVGAGLINGRATINVWGWDDWSVSAIALEGWKDSKPVYVEISLTEHGQIYTAILHQLENGEFRKNIEGAVQRELEELAA